MLNLRAGHDSAVNGVSENDACLPRVLSIDSGYAGTQLGGRIH